VAVDQVRDMCQTVGELHAAGRHREAVELAEGAVELCRDTLGKTHYAWPLTLCAAAACHVAVGEKDRASGELEEAVQHARIFQAHDFEHARSTLTHAAELYGELGEHRLARQLWQELIQLTGQELGEDHPRYFAARDRLASARGDAQDPSKPRT
jgi:hypothetical protein